MNSTMNIKYVNEYRNILYKYMKLGSIQLYNTCYKCTNDREIVICMIKKSEYCKLKLKYI